MRSSMRLRLCIVSEVTIEENIEQGQMNAFLFHLDSVLLHMSAFRVLIILAHQEIPPTMGELSAELNVPDSTATRIVDWLVQSSFVVRLPDPSDRRVIRVSMTESGQGFYEISSHYIQQRIGVLLSDFSDVEKAEFYRLLTKLYVAFQREE